MLPAMSDKDGNKQSLLRRIAERAMRSRGLEPSFPQAALAELEKLREPAPDPSLRDLRKLLWCSIDNDDSRDLDQLSVSEALPSGSIKVLVAVADVDSTVKKGS